MTVSEVRLELARSHDFPEGHPGCGYVMHLPLNPERRLDVEAWREERDHCKVQRFWIGMDDQSGRLIHTRHKTWAVSYEPGEEDDTPFFHLESHAFKEGDYVTVTEQDGKDRTFKIVRVRA